MNFPEKPHAVYSSTLDDERLAYMATGYADAISLAELAKLNLAANDVVLDIGAGSSTNLPHKIMQTGANYIALDKNPSSSITQRQIGAAAVLANATRLPFANESISLVHARFSTSWLDENGRSQMWDEVIRAGRQDLRGVVSEYDWTVTRGLPVYRSLISSMRNELVALGFNPSYGAEVQNDVRQILNQKLGYEISLEATRRPIPALSAAEKLAAVKLTAQSLQAALLSIGKKSQAEVLEAQLNELTLHLKNTDEITLPDIVSVAFRCQRPANIKTGPAKPELASCLPTLNSNDEEPKILQLENNIKNAGMRSDARKFLTTIYTRTGYIDKQDISETELLEATDPENIFKRSDIFIVQNQHNKIVTSARLVYPNNEGLSSLPTGNKIIKKYGDSILPKETINAQIGESGYFVSVSRNALIAARIVIAIMQAAQRANMEYVLFGAVLGKTDEHFNNLFGPAKKDILISGERASVTVTGRGYIKSGIELGISYFKTSDFIPDMLSYYKNNHNKHADYIIQLCNLLHRPSERD